LMIWIKVKFWKKREYLQLGYREMPPAEPRGLGL
jgi:hypothetical protein